MSDLVYILPHFCPHEFFHGWHLYERDRPDGTRNDDGEWGWLQGALSLKPVRQLCTAIGHDDMPAVTYASGSGEYHAFVEEFAARFPAGLRARRRPYHELEAVPLGFDLYPDRQIVRKDLRLYFAWRDGKMISLMATDTDDAESILEAVYKVGKKWVK